MIERFRRLFCISRSFLRPGEVINNDTHQYEILGLETGSFPGTVNWRVNKRRLWRCVKECANHGPKTWVNTPIGETREEVIADAALTHIATQHIRYFVGDFFEKNRELFDERGWHDLSLLDQYELVMREMGNRLEFYENSALAVDRKIQGLVAQNAFAIYLLPESGITTNRFRFAWRRPNGACDVECLKREMQEYLDFEMRPSVISESRAFAECYEYVIHRACELYRKENMRGKKNPKPPSIISFDRLSLLDRETYIERILKILPEEAKDLALAEFADKQRIENEVRSRPGDDEVASHYRTYLRLVHSFLRPFKHHTQDLPNLRIFGPLIARRRIQGGPVRIGWLVEDLEDDPNHELYDDREDDREDDRNDDCDNDQYIYSESWCLQEIERGLRLVAAELFIKENEHQYSTVENGLDAFYDLPCLDQIILVNRAWRDRIERECGSSQFIKPATEDIAVRNFLFAYRMPEPGLALDDIFLVKPLTGERWNIKYIDWSDDLRSFTDSEGGRVHVICSLELVGECEDFVIERAKRIFLELAKMGVSDPDDRWNWMTFTERTKWRALAIDAIQSEQEVLRRGRSMAERYKDR